MSFGRRRFDRLVLVSGEPHARFLPLDHGHSAEHFNENQLRVALETNRLCAAPLNDEEEQLALRAFLAFARNPKVNPVRTALAQQARTARQQEPTLVVVDPLSPKERATVERFRKLVAYPVKPTNKEREIVPHYDSDLGRTVLAILDTHCPKAVL